MHRFLCRQDEETGALVALPTEEARSNVIAWLKREAAAELTKTDWYVVRAADPTSDAILPETVYADRVAVRALAAALEVEAMSADVAGLDGMLARGFCAA